MEKKKNRLWYFESYDEIRAYVAQGFPSRVYLTTRRCAVVRENDEVVHQKNFDPTDHNGERVPQQQIDNGYVVAPSFGMPVVVMGHLEDYPVEEYAVIHNFQRRDIKADTLLEGLYAAGDDMASRLRTVKSEKRSIFTAKEMMVPMAKGGPMLDEISDGVTMCYFIVTETSHYEFGEENVWRLIDAIEKAEGVGAAKRRRFTIEKAAGADSNIVACLTMESDKILPKMKKCCAKDELHIVMQQPAIELSTGIMVASDGHVLAAHRMGGYSAEVTGDTMFDTVSLPIEVTQMKGTITVEIEKNEEPGGRGIIITATDEKGKTGTVNQTGRFPNWRSVIPKRVGKAVNVDVGAWMDAVKKVLPHVCPASELMWLDAERGADTMRFCGEDLDFSLGTTVDVDIEGGVPNGMWVGLKASKVKDALMFNPTKMHYTDYSRAVVFVSDDALVLQMPMLLEEKPTTPRGPQGDDDCEDLDIDELLKGEVRSKKSEVRGKKSKAKKPQTSNISHQPSLADRLRMALQGRLAA